MELELRKQAHLMDYEGTSETKPSILDIKLAVRKRGYEIGEINIGFDDFQHIWRFNGKLGRKVDPSAKN